MSSTRTRQQQRQNQLWMEQLIPWNDRKLTENSLSKEKMLDSKYKRAQQIHMTTFFKWLKHLEQEFKRKDIEDNQSKYFNLVTKKIYPYITKMRMPFLIFLL